MCKSSLHRECLHCGTTFEPYRSTSKYCSKKCLERASNLKKKTDPHKQKIKRCGELRRKYGITLEERDAMYADQEGKCKVCETHMTLDSRKPSSAHVDHCHTTGEVHGLLCSYCNTAAGLLGENPKIAASLVQYLLDTAKVLTR
jgi:hypothetical protein